MSVPKLLAILWIIISNLGIFVLVPLSILNVVNETPIGFLWASILYVSLYCVAVGLLVRLNLLIYKFGINRFVEFVLNGKKKTRESL